MLATTRRHLLRALVAILAAGVAVLPLRANAEDKGPVVFAAASLKDALDAVNDAWQKQGGKKASISYAASSALAKQIEQDAPADVFISADEDWMDYLATRKLIRADTRFDLLGNTLVLIAPKDSKLTTTVTPGFPLASLVGEGHLAMADTASVPAGKYGKAALEKLDVWDGVKHKIAQAENVRAALASYRGARRRSASSTPPTRNPIRTSRLSTHSLPIRTHQSSIPRRQRHHRPVMRLASSTSLSREQQTAFSRTKASRFSFQ